MTTICAVIGARPQFIKAAVVSRALRHTAGFREVVIHTGQHYDESMSGIFFEELGIPKPDYSLGIGSGAHGWQTGRMLEALEPVLLKERPDWVLVYGDTNSTLAGALSAAKLHVPIAHVEAGLRSYNRRMPEEVNRVLTDHVSDLLFAPTEAAVANLEKEGIQGDPVVLVGDVMFDCALYYAARALSQSTILEQLGLEQGKYVLATIHRAENTDNQERLEMLLGGLESMARSIPVVVPLHPRTRARVNGSAISLAQLTVCEPVGYLDMVALTRHAALVCTDSGGLQKEAFFHGVPCFTLRPETEWIELVALGCNTLLSATNSRQLAQQALEAMGRGFPEKARKASPYGEGRTGERIARCLQERSAAAAGEG